MSLAELLASTGGELLGAGSGTFSFSTVQTDSRAVTAGGLFVPLVGAFRDGHAYIQDAMDKGASAVLVSRGDGEIFALARKNPAVAFVRVADTLRALQDAAEAYVAKFPGLMKVSVTGSSGKTTTKEILASILRQKYRVISNEGNLNSETGLPLSVFAIRAGHELGLFEMGMNREGEMGELSKVLKPNFALVTNIGTAHIGRLGSRENIAREKKRIFSYVDERGVCAIPKDDDFADILAEGVRGKVVRYGLDADARISVLGDDGLLGTRFLLDGTEVRLALPGKHNFLNALGAIALSRELGLSAEHIKRGIESLPALGGRSEVVRKGGFTVLKDCYNANPDSMEKALELSASVAVPGKKILVIGDMLELGSESRSAHERAGEQALRARADCVVFLGDEMRAAFEKAAEQNVGGAELLHIAGNGASAMEEAARAVRAASGGGTGHFLLLKGSRGMGLERICEQL